MADRGREGEHAYPAISVAGYSKAGGAGTLPIRRMPFARGDFRPVPARLEKSRPPGRLAEQPTSNAKSKYLTKRDLHRFVVRSLAAQ